MLDGHLQEGEQHGEGQGPTRGVRGRWWELRRGGGGGVRQGQAWWGLGGCHRSVAFILRAVGRAGRQQDAAAFLDA